MWLSVSRPQLSRSFLGLQSSSAMPKAGHDPALSHVRSYGNTKSRSYVIYNHIRTSANVVRINHQLGTAYTALRTSQPRATSKRSSAALCPKGNRRNDVTVSFHVCHRDKLTAARNSGILITAMCLKLNLE